MDKVYTVTQAAAYLGVTRPMIYHYLHKNKKLQPVPCTGDEPILIAKTELDRLKAARMSTGGGRNMPKPGWRKGVYPPRQ